MKIRAITVFADVGPPLDEALIAGLGTFAQTARQAFENSGTEVQTSRLATNIFPRLRFSEWADRPAAFAARLAQVCQQHGFDYVALGPAERDVWPQIPEVLAAAPAAFVTVRITNRATGTIEGDAIRGAANIIKRCATVEPDGFANLRFAALANVKPGTPFFPAAYYHNGPPAFALATEAADMAVAACADARDAEMVRWRLVTAIEKAAKKLARRANNLSKAHEISFLGIDFSLAPFPGPETSIGTALERLSGRVLGSAGSLAAAAVLTDAIDRAQFPRCGFSGLMLPLLEDAVLAQRAAEGRLSIGQLLQWSAVCGTGLDTIPLPGDVSEGDLAMLLLDVAALAVRLKKPLAARLMPIPEKQAGDPIHFDFAYFADSRVLTLDTAPGVGLLARTPELRLTTRMTR